MRTAPAERTKSFPSRKTHIANRYEKRTLGICRYRLGALPLGGAYRVVSVGFGGVALVPVSIRRPRCLLSVSGDEAGRTAKALRRAG